MKRIFVPMLAAMGLLASDHSGVRPRGGAKDYAAYGSAAGFTIAASVVPAGKVKHQLSPDLVKAGYTVVEVAIYPDPGKEVDVFPGDFTLRIGSNPTVANAEAPTMVVRSIEADKRAAEPQIPSRVHVYGEVTTGVSTGGGDPVTGRRYPSSVYTGTGVGVGVGDPKAGNPPPTDPIYSAGDPRNPDVTGAGAPPATPWSLGDKLAEKGLPKGRTRKPVAGYLYFPQVARRLVNGSDPYHVDYSGSNVQIHLTLTGK